MHMESQSHNFSGVNQVAIVADPSMHGGDETMVGVVYSHERKVAAMAPLNVLAHGKYFDPCEVEMTPAVQQLDDEVKTERRAAYKETQSILKMASAYTGGGAESFKKPHGVTIRAVRQGEARITRMSETGQRMAYIVDVGSGHMVREIPADGPADDMWPCLTVRLDKGSVGKAAGIFLQNGLEGDEQQLVYFAYDKLHTSIRDIANSADKTVHRDTIVKSSHWMSLNYKPWNSGACEKEKRNILNAFLQLEHPDSAFFLAWVELLCLGFGWVYDGSRRMRQGAWRRLGALNSFMTKGPLGKLMRWFAWNQCVDFHMPEYWALAMLLAWHFDHGRARPADNDHEIADMHALRNAQVSGMQIAGKCMNMTLFIRMKAWYIITQPTWTWYTNEAVTVLGPAESIAAAIDVHQHGWWTGELQDLLKRCFIDEGTLKWIGFSRSVHDPAEVITHGKEVAYHVSPSNRNFLCPISHFPFSMFPIFHFSFSCFPFSIVRFLI